jgi:hypothetical protein
MTKYDDEVSEDDARIHISDQSDGWNNLIFWCIAIIVVIVGYVMYNSNTTPSVPAKPTRELMSREMTTENWVRYEDDRVYCYTFNEELINCFKK